MGKLNSNLLLFALAFGEEGRAEGAAPPPQAAALQVGSCRGKSLPCSGVPSVPEIRGLWRVRTLFLRRQKNIQVLAGHISTRRK